MQSICRIVAAVSFVALIPAAVGAWPEKSGPESRRMSRAKDLIADEQWGRAIEELRAALADAKEPSKAEALFWLAHSQNQENDVAAAVETIRRLQREYGASRWAMPARSLLIELAQKLRRNDVLWWHATPPASPTPVVPPATGSRTPRAGRPPAAKSPEPSTPSKVAPVGSASAPAPAPSAPPFAWLAETWHSDSDQRILALGSLINTDEHKVIPMLRDIALEKANPGAARRAVFVLAQSRKPNAQSAVVEVATRGPEQVRPVAVRELGRFGGPDVSEALVQVYATAPTPVKQQVVASLGERQEAPALLRIVQTEENRYLRGRAIIALGRAGGRDELRWLYAKADRESKHSIITGLFTARAEDELIHIADQEKDDRLRAEVRSRLRLLGTPKARAYLAKSQGK